MVNAGKVSLRESALPKPSFLRRRNSLRSELSCPRRRIFLGPGPARWESRTATAAQIVARPPCLLCPLCPMCPLCPSPAALEARRPASARPTRSPPRGLTPGRHPRRKKTRWESQATQHSTQPGQALCSSSSYHQREKTFANEPLSLRRLGV